MNLKGLMLASTLSVSSIFCLGMNEVSASSIFTDVPTSHWAKASIDELSNLGYISGYTNGTFGINDKVTRGQVASVLVRWMKDEGKLKDKDNLKNPFTDVPSSAWYSHDVLLAVDAELMNGKGNSKFDPNATMTRAEMATVLVNALGTSKKADYTFYDVAPTHWASENIKNAYSNGLVSGTGNDGYTPNGSVTRGQMAQFISNGIHMDSDFEAKPIADVVTVSEVKNETVAYTTVTQNDSSLAKGQTKVKTDGVNGTKQVTYQKTYTKGVLTDTKTVSSTITKQPVNKVVLVGTKETNYSTKLSKEQAANILDTTTMTGSNGVYELRFGKMTDSTLYVTLDNNGVDLVSYDPTEYKQCKDISEMSVERIMKWLHYNSSDSALVKENAKKRISLIEDTVMKVAESVYGEGTTKSKELYNTIISSKVTYEKFF